MLASLCLFLVIYFCVTTAITVLTPHVLSTIFYVFIAKSQRAVHEKTTKGKLFGPKAKAYFYSLAAWFTSNLIAGYAWLMHSYSVEGLENVPRDPSKPALLIFYHGITPPDMVFVANYIYRKYGRLVRCVGDRFLFAIPGPRRHTSEYLFSGPAARCVRVLKDGHLLEIAPGGTREAQFATRKYETLWNNRCGFARVAQEAKVDIIPVFTRNIRQVYVLPRLLQRMLRPLYEKTRLPVVPFFGGFPVQLTTYFGKPIPHDIAPTPEDLSHVVQQAIDQMIVQHQNFPATFAGGVAERFYH